MKVSSDGSLFNRSSSNFFFLRVAVGKGDFEMDPKAAGLCLERVSWCGG